MDINYTIYDIADLPVSDEQIAKARSSSERRGGRYLIIDDAKAAADAAATIKAGEKTFADYWQAVENKTLAGQTGELSPNAKGKGVSPEVDEALFALEKPATPRPSSTANTATSSSNSAPSTAATAATTNCAASPPPKTKPPTTTTPTRPLTPHKAANRSVPSLKSPAAKPKP